ncbi:sugar diacid recognition domain-containing protein [Bacillus sp. FJAT-27445]|uniref:CdaR family transcriptional regulator n=1 Tax=Bacillus sp. FJAT-27445 TaxID=1679166 RepID=UPI0007438355|nr:sugar diacid recognition domain-containing protein [Bacillus sp. FJAT-27445]
MLNPDLAGKIVNEVKRLIDEDVIVVSTDGTIIASTDQSRIGAFHEGALIAAREKRKITITVDEQTTLKGVKAGMNLPIFFQNEVIGIVGITGDPSKVAPFGEIIRKMTELLIAEDSYTSQFEWQSRAVETFVIDWLQNQNREDSLTDRARLLGIDLSLARIAAIIEFKAIRQPISRQTWSVIFNWPLFLQSDVVARWGNDRIVLLLDYSLKPEREEIERKIRQFHEFLSGLTGIVPFIGLGQAVAPLSIEKSYTHAVRALNIASEGNPVVFDEDLTLEMLLDDLNTEIKKEFITRTVGPILKERDLLQTISEFFSQNQSYKNTAKNLHIHINTLHYRLKRIKELTNHDAGRTSDVTAMYLAIRLLDKHTKIDLL